MRIGIDVGGTHTDAVIIDGREIIAAHKATTSSDISSGIVNALTTVLETTRIDTAELDAVMLGTTQFTNAIVERRNLSEVAVIRIALPSGEIIPPMLDWPEDLRNMLGNHVYMIHGGSEFNGRDIAPLDDKEIETVIDDIRKKGLDTISLAAVFSPIKADVEQAVAAKIQRALPEAKIVFSHELGRLGLLERENAAILNACLLQTAQWVVSAFEDVLRHFKIEAPFFISQNDGTVMKSNIVKRYPVLTFSSGPTNSMRGAAFLSGLENAIVADVGGTTTDIGMLNDGFPRESSWTVEIGGVRSNYRMPDILAIGLGGGSLVEGDGTTVGPQSLGHELVTKALCFGGETLTATDIAVKAGLVNIGTTNKFNSINDKTLTTALETMRQITAEAVDRIKTSAAKLPLIAVGGGQFLIADEISGISRILRPPHSDVANAVGAALAQVSGEIEILYQPQQESRDIVAEKVQQQAIARAIEGGAEPQSVKIVAVDEIPVPYMTEDTVRIHARAIGDLGLSKGSEA